MAKAQQSVDGFLKDLDSPELALINQTRKEIAKASNRLVEGIKWNAPSYSLDGNDIIAFNFRNFGSVALIFHTGPKGKDTHAGKPLFSGYEGIVEWVADRRFVVRIESAILGSSMKCNGIAVSKYSSFGRYFSFVIGINEKGTK